ncbi:MAG TPA: vgr related protein [Novosphingobium sp.]|nr:vgr related protein [Novosphingobium sp.]
MFGTAIDLSRVSIRRRKFFPFQPREVAMTPRGHLHFHPRASAYCEDFAAGSIDRQALFIHELTHAWQAQERGPWWLVLMRHPWCRYDYALRPGWKLERYGIEQQAEIVKHAFLLRRGVTLRGVGDPAAYDLLVRFPGADR